MSMPSHTSNDHDLENTSADSRGGSYHTNRPQSIAAAEIEDISAHGTPEADLRWRWNGGGTRDLNMHINWSQSAVGLSRIQSSTMHAAHAVADHMMVRKRQYRFKTRQKAQQKTLSRRQEARMETLQKTMHENPFLYPRPCCKAGCFYVVDPEYAVVQYRRFLQMDREARKRALKSMYVRDAGAFWFGGAYVCTRFVSKGLQFSNQLQCAVKATPKARASSSIVALPRRNMKETKKNQIILYLRDLADRTGDSLPTRPHNNLPLMSKK